MRCCVPLSVTVLAFATLSLSAQQPTGVDDAKARLEALHAVGVKASLVLHPVRVLDRPSKQVAEALGLVLESQGMPDLEVAGAPFDPPKGTKWADVSALFGAHIGKLGGDAANKHHVYAEFLGTPKTGPEEVRFVVVDGAGRLVLVDRQTPADAAFQRTAKKDPDPLGCATLVAERLFTLADWKKTPGAVRDGKFGKSWKERSGVPDKAEFAAMKARLATLRAGLAQARIAVLPTLVGGAHDAVSASRLAAALSENLRCRAEAVADGSKLEVAASSNEQKRLWDLARSLKGLFGKAPATAADYVLVADLGVDPERKHCYLHVVLTTATGEFVVVDFQNDQSPAVSQAMPATLADAEALLVQRLALLLR